METEREVRRKERKKVDRRHTEDVITHIVGRERFQTQTRIVRIHTEATHCRFRGRNEVRGLSLMTISPEFFFEAVKLPCCGIPS